MRPDQESSDQPASKAALSNVVSLGYPVLPCQLCVDMVCVFVGSLLETNFL